MLELTTHPQDLGVFAPESLGMPLLLGALKHHGVAHFLFHPAHFAKPQAVAGMETIVRRGREHGMEWWTAQQINDWVRNRRTFTWQLDGSDGVTLTTKMDLSQATLLCLGSVSTAKINDQLLSAGSVHRWGFDFVSAILDIPGRSEP